MVMMIVIQIMKFIRFVLPLLLICAVPLTLYSQGGQTENEAEEKKTLSYMEHEMKTNKIICQKTKECGQKVDMNECITRLDGVSRAKYFNKEVIVWESRSEKCLKFLKKQPCKGISSKVIAGPCNRQLLQTK